jgi:predicted PurR-regulated permease PerM
VGDRARLNELVIFFALLGGVQMFGLLGILLGPVLFAVVIAIAEALNPQTPDA